MRRLAVVSLVAAAATLPAAPAGAERMPLLPPMPQNRFLVEHGGPVHPVTPFRSGFTAEANGYRIGVATFGGGVAFQVWRGGKDRQTLTAYLARGVAKPERLQATFGNFGRVSMRFRESRAGPRKVCRFGQAVLKRRGVFVGNLRFRGEGGYIDVRLHRAKGAIVTPRGRCRFRPRKGGNDDSFRDLFELFFSPKAAIFALSRDGTDSTSLLALESKRSGLFVASDEESRGKLAIIRLGEVLKPSLIRVNESLTGASLAPPAPFHGTGRYRASPDGSSTWLGNLSVNFPGAPRFPLTGPSWEPFVEVPF